MEYEVDKINRTVHFIHAPIFDPQSSTGVNNTWKYDRAPDGYKFILVAIDVSTSYVGTNHAGIFGLFDGHEYTHWNMFPGVESKEYLWRSEVNSNNISIHGDLHNWECKEFTIGCRSMSESQAVKACVIIWFYLRKMTPDETKMYAVLQPKSEHYPKGGPRTLTRGEETD